MRTGIQFRRPNLGIADEQRAVALNAQSTAVVESQIRATQQALAEANFKQAEALRLALETNRLVLAGGNPEQIALLSLRSMNTQYTPEGEAALVAASRLDYPLQHFLHPGRVMPAAFSPDGRYLLTGSWDNHVKLWDTKTGQELRPFVGHTAGVVAVEISPDGKYILTGSYDKTARLWDMASGQEVRRFMARAARGRGSSRPGRR